MWRVLFTACQWVSSGKPSCPGGWRRLVGLGGFYRLELAEDGGSVLGFVSSSLNTAPPVLLDYRTTVLSLTIQAILGDVCHVTEQALPRNRMLFDDNSFIYPSNKFKSISHQS
jgi:hypothetical protein